MEVNISKQDDIEIVELVGEIDAKNAKDVQDQVLPLAQTGSRILLDMSGLEYMSSAGLRMMLLIYRTVSGNNGRIVLVGLSENLQDMMSATGFLSFFTLSESRDAAIKTLKEDA
jgi:anti-sigma B factor antagonist